MRKTKELTITAEGRDKGKVFILTEMPSQAAEDWGARALNGMARSNVEIPDSVVGSGIIGVYYMGLKTLFAADFPVLKGLLDEMMACVAFRPDPANPTYLRPLIGSSAIADDVEEVATRVTLREEVFALHVGFTLAEAISMLTSALDPRDSPSTETSQS